MPREYTKMKHLEATVFEMKDAGKTNAQIGAELGLTKAQIKGLVKRYNRKANAAAKEDSAAPKSISTQAANKKSAAQTSGKAAGCSKGSAPSDAAPALKQTTQAKKGKAATSPRKKPPAAVDSPAAVEPSAAKKSPAAMELPAAKDSPAAVKPPAAKESPAAVDSPAAKESPAAVDSPAAKEPPAAKESPATAAPQRVAAKAPAADVMEAERVLQPAPLGAASSPQNMRQALRNLREEMDALEGTVHEIDRMWSRLEKSRKALNTPSQKQ